MYQNNWFTFTATCNCAASASITVTSGTFTAQFLVYTGGACLPSVCTALTGGSQYGTTVSWDAIAGTTYLIANAPFPEYALGTYTLNFACV
jgi:hypothetical protein